MNSVLSTRVERSTVVGSRSCSRAVPRASTRARRAFGPLLGLTLLVSGCRGCSYHAHSEWQAGSGSSGGEEVAEPNEQGEGEGSTRSTHRRSPGGRDNVVRVTGDGNKSQGGQSSGGDPPERAVVRPTGDVPPSSSGGSGQGSGGDSAQGGSSDGTTATGGSTGKADEPSAPAQPSEPAAAAPSEQAPDGGKTTNKNPSEPHVTTPTHRKPRKVHRDGATNKEGRRE